MKSAEKQRKSKKRGLPSRKGNKDDIKEMPGRDGLAREKGHYGKWTFLTKD